MLSTSSVTIFTFGIARLRAFTREFRTSGNVEYFWVAGSDLNSRSMFLIRYLLLLLLEGTIIARSHFSLLLETTIFCPFECSLLGIICRYGG